MMELWNEFDRLVVFDTETTGIEFGTDRIIEIGAAALENGEEQGGFNALIRLPAGQTLPHFITQLTGITDEQLRDEGVDDRTAAEGFCRLLDGADLVITGEGRIDSQSVHGKAISGIACGFPIGRRPRLHDNCRRRNPTPEHRSTNGNRFGSRL